MADEKPILLIAEDEQGVAETLVALAKRWGFEPRLFDNGQATLEELQSIGRPVVLLTDHGLKNGRDGSNLTGFDINTEVKKRYPDMPVIMLSGNGNNRKQAEAEGMMFFVKGGYTINELKTAIEAAQRKLEGGRTPMDHATRPTQGGSKGLFD
jgi:DNA-binding NtrC family response regulator